MDKDYDPYTSYLQSKLANVLFNRELAVRLRGKEYETLLTLLKQHTVSLKIAVLKHNILFNIQAQESQLTPFILE